MAETGTEEKTCSRCGRRFPCGARCANCWCQALPTLPSAVLDRAVDCRCPQCLAELAGVAPPPA